ncbi:hypothetical protein Vi05172_g13625 [Venturia inaequalis]|nr:hypothetical protein Vi05172_g13625 [Venturia inaequalis]
MAAWDRCLEKGMQFAEGEAEAEVEAEAEAET